MAPAPSPVARSGRARRRRADAVRAGVRGSRACRSDPVRGAVRRRSAGAVHRPRRSRTPCRRVAPTRARRRRAAREAWPRLIEELRVLTGSVGRSIPQALLEVGLRGPVELRSAFEAAQREWSLTTDLGRTIGVLKDRLDDPTADAACETLLVAAEVGGDIDARLAALAEDRRQDLAGATRGRSQAGGSPVRPGLRDPGTCGNGARRAQRRRRASGVPDRARPGAGRTRARGHRRLLVVGGACHAAAGTRAGVRPMSRSVDAAVLGRRCVGCCAAAQCRAVVPRGRAWLHASVRTRSAGLPHPARPLAPRSASWPFRSSRSGAPGRAEHLVSPRTSRPVSNGRGASSTQLRSDSAKPPAAPSRCC